MVPEYKGDYKNAFSYRVSYLLGRSKKNKWKKNRRKSK